MSVIVRPVPFHRRRFLIGAAAASGAAILTACGGGEKATETPKSAPLNVAASTTTEPTNGAIVPATVAGKTTGASKGELRVSVGVEFPAAVDGTKSGFQLIGLGAAETLTRITPQGQLEPWLAEQVTNIDPFTWRVRLRANVKFWDGTPVTPEDVVTRSIPAPGRGDNGSKAAPRMRILYRREEGLHWQYPHLRTTRAPR